MTRLRYIQKNAIPSISNIFKDGPDVIFSDKRSDTKCSIYHMQSVVLKTYIVPGIDMMGIYHNLSCHGSCCWRPRWPEQSCHNHHVLPHDDVIKWKHFPCYWPFVWGIHWSPVNSPHKGQWRGALMHSLIWVWINGWVNNREAGDLRRYRAQHRHCNGRASVDSLCSSDPLGCHRT